MSAWRREARTVSTSATAWRHPARSGPNPSPGPTAACASTCGCPISSRAVTWRCGSRRLSSMTSSCSTSSSHSPAPTAPTRWWRTPPASTPARAGSAGSCATPPTSRRCRRCWCSSPATSSTCGAVRSSSRTGDGRWDWCAPRPATSMPTWPPVRPMSDRGCATWPAATGRGCTATRSGRSSGDRGGVWSTTGPPRLRSGRSSTRCFTAGSAGASSRPRPLTAGSTRPGPPGRPPRAAPSSPASMPRSCRCTNPGRALPPTPVGTAHTRRRLHRWRPPLRRLAFLFGGPDRLRTAMAEWYQANAGRSVTTDGLAAHLHAWSGIDISPWWARYVHGRG